MSRALNISYGHADDAINFSVAAVTAMGLDEWLLMAGTQYFAHLDEDERQQALKDVYAQCLQAKKDAMPKHEATDAQPLVTANIADDKQQKGNIRKSGTNDEPAPVNPKL